MGKEHSFFDGLVGLECKSYKGQRRSPVQFTILYIQNLQRYLFCINFYVHYCYPNANRRGFLYKVETLGAIATYFK